MVGKRKRDRVRAGMFGKKCGRRWCPDQERRRTWSGRSHSKSGVAKKKKDKEREREQGRSWLDRNGRDKGERGKGKEREGKGRDKDGKSGKREKLPETCPMSREKFTDTISWLGQVRSLDHILCAVSPEVRVGPGKGQEHELMSSLNHARIGRKVKGRQESDNKSRQTSALAMRYEYPY